LTDTPCDDTPNHGNTCYSHAPPNCDWDRISNNQMSYALPWRRGFSPCQIDIMLNNLNGFLSNYCTTCPLLCTTAQTNYFLTENIACASDIAFMQTVYSSSTNYTRYRIKIQRNTNSPTNFFYNSGWLTGQLPSSFNLASVTGANLTPTGYYNVVISTDNYPSCIGESSMQKTFQVVSNTQCGSLRVALSPNPANDNLVMDLEIKKKGKFSATLTDAMSTPLSIIYPEEMKNEGKEQKNTPIGHLKPGLYFVVFRYEGEQFVKSIRIVR
jgi:hypothetical protein